MLIWLAENQMGFEENCGTYWGIVYLLATNKIVLLM